MLKLNHQKNSFISNVATLAGGNIIAQSVIVLSSPILTRLYTPEDFGVLAVFTAILSTIVIFSALSYESAIPLPSSDKKAAQLVVLSLFILILISLLTIFLTFSFSKHLAPLVDKDNASIILYLLPIGVFFGGLYQILSFWGIRKQHFSLIAVTKLIQSGCLVTIQIAGAAGGALFLLIGQVFGQAAGFLKLLRKSLLEIWILAKQSTTADYKATASEFKKFPLFETWGRAFNTGSGHLPSILFALWFSPAAAGLFILANRVVLVPMQLIGSAIANAFYSEAPQAFRENRLGEMVQKLHSTLSSIITLPVLLLAIIAPQIFSWIFGGEWLVSGEFVRAMTLMLYMQFLTSPLSQTYNIMSRQEIGVYIQILMLFFRTIAIYIGAYYENLLLAVSLYSLLTAICYLLLLVWVFAVSNCNPMKIVTTSIKDIVTSLVILAPLFLGLTADFSKASIIALSTLTTILGCLYYFYIFKKIIKNNRIKGAQAQ